MERKNVLIKGRQKAKSARRKMPNDTMKVVNKINKRREIKLKTKN